jgi:hypothetical protein
MSQESKSVPSDLERNTVIGRLIIDDVAWSLLEDTIKESVLPADSIRQRLLSITDWLALGFLNEQGLLAVTELGAAVTDRGQSIFNELSSKVPENS